MRKISIFAFIMVFLASACATTPRTLPEKYNLDNILEAIDKITIYKLTDCENIDNQSIIIEADRDFYYLLVLDRPININYSYLTIDIGNIENTVSKDRAYSAQELIGSKNTSRGGPNTEFVQAPSNMASITSGYDRFVAGDETNRQYYVIEKIYKLKGKEQEKEIKERLREMIP